ncbi:MAG: hypothetical protein H7301_03810 [Cryobacterium sp.]|nr:hypothetical protein [Oligoflexia bacterium]
MILDGLEIDRFRFLSDCISSAGPGIYSLKKIADYFDMSLDDLIDDRIDSDWVRRPTLNERYRAADGSKFRTSLPLLHWLEKNYGEATQKNVLRSVKVPAELLQFPDQSVKLSLLRDLIHAAKVRGLTDDAVFAIGLSALKIGENETIRKSLSGYRSPTAAYEFFFGPSGPIERFETNFRYRIEKMNSSSVTLSVTPYAERMTEIGAETMYDRSLSIYRWGAASGVLGLVSGTLQGVTPLRTANNAGDSELFEISWLPDRHQAARGRASLSPLRLL